MKLKHYLNSKPIFYKDIKLKNVTKAWDMLKTHINLPYTIHLIGTNGKGSTGRFIANGLLNDEIITCCEHHSQKNNHSVVHFSSPHILEVNERIWLNGANVADAMLDRAHIRLLDILGNKLCDGLSYFEYITLICFVISDNKDYLVIEAGLGGEYDATNVVENNLSVITTIDYDHQEFLGDSIEQIATTKINACDKSMIIAKQKHEEVYLIAKKIAKQKGLKIIQNKNNKEYEMPNTQMARYLKSNLQTAIGVLSYLDINFSVSKLSKTSLFGRASTIRDNIIIDVGHNPLGAEAILNHIKNNHKNSHKNKCLTLIYNSYSNKDYKTTLNILSEVIDEVLYISIDDEQMCDKSDIKQQCDYLSIAFDVFKGAKDLKSEKEYLVFGSFKVVEAFLLQIDYKIK